MDRTILSFKSDLWFCLKQLVMIDYKLWLVIAMSVKCAEIGSWPYLMINPMQFCIILSHARGLGLTSSSIYKRKLTPLEQMKLIPMYRLSHM